MTKVGMGSVPDADQKLARKQRAALKRKFAELSSKVERMHRQVRMSPVLVGHF